MANLAVSAVCNLACVYCFAHDHTSKSANTRHYIDLLTYDKLLDFLDRSDIDEARLLGGEPTLHPDFPELVRRAVAHGKKIVVFSNGLMPPKALESLLTLPEESCLVLMNVNTPADIGQKVHNRQLETLRQLGKRAMPGFNIYRMDFDLSFLAAIIHETGCKPALRLGLAQPCLSGENRYIHPKQYRFVAEKIVRFAGENPGIRLEFDCGFVRCMFSDEELRILRQPDSAIEWRCGPILDIDVDGKAIHCYPLSELDTIEVTPADDAAALRQHFEAVTRPYRQSGIYPECATCSFKQAGQCSGGCLSTTIRRFQHTPFEVSIPDPERP